MKIKLVFIIVLSSFIPIFSQINVNSYELGKLYKTFENTPAGNTILDIIIINDTMWIATTKGLSRSIDGGLTFKNFYNTPIFGTESISAIGYNKGVIWAATAHNTTKNGQSLPEGSGLRYSTDNGETWTSISQPKDSQSDSSVVYGINTLRALPVTVDINNIIYDIAFTKNTIWIATFAGGLRKSTDMGITWQRVVLPPDNLNQIKPTDVLNFSLQPVAGAFGKESYLNHRVFSVSSADDTTLYVGTAGGINKSTDNGISWVKFNHENQEFSITGNFVVGICAIPNTQKIWAATWKAEGQNETYGVSYSYDGGNKWFNFLEGEKAHNFGYILENNGSSFNDEKIFAATDNGIYLTTNNGDTWFAPLNIYDASQNLFISPAETDFYCMNSVIKNNKRDIFIGSTSGLLKFVPAGNLWDGTWSVLLSSQKLNSTSDTYSFPNPFSPDVEVTKIKFRLNNPAEVTIRIMDFGMNLVRTLSQNYSLSAGDNFIVWDGRDENGKIVPNGVYFYRIDKGDSDPIFGKIMVLL
jgi:hypothetical protein